MFTCPTYGLAIEDDLVADLVDHIVAHLRDRTYEMPDRLDYPELAEDKFANALVIAGTLVA